MVSPELPELPPRNSPELCMVSPELAQIMQYLVEPGWTANTHSETIVVP